MAARVLFIGFDPAAMDLAGAPPGTAEQIRAGIDRSMAGITALGFAAEFCPLAEGDAGAEEAVRARLRGGAFHCVVIGAGVRLLAKHTVLFEALVAAAREAAPDAALAFNATPGDAADAVRRRLRA